MEACHARGRQSGPRARPRARRGWQDGRDKVTINPNTGGFGLWAEQLLAESTGKEGKGLIPAPGESPDGARPAGAGGAADRARTSSVRSSTAGSSRPRSRARSSASTRSTSPTCRRRRTRRTRCWPGAGAGRSSRAARSTSSSRRRGPATTSRSRRSSIPGARPSWSRCVERARAETGCVVTHGLGPRYLHSTGQLHKGGPNTGLVRPGGRRCRATSVAIPAAKFGFRRLIQPQAAGDFASLEERGARASCESDWRISRCSSEWSASAEWAGT